MTRFTPEDPDYAARVRASFERQAVMHTLGVSLQSVAPGTATLQLPYDPGLGQQHGFLHAGIVATLLDSACGYAAFSLMPADAAVLTVEFKVNLLAPATGETFLARGGVKRAGRTLFVCTADLEARGAGTAKTVATMLATIMRLSGRDGIRH